MKPFVAAAVALTVLLAAAAYFVNATNDCDRRGGVLVRGVIGYDCVERRP